MIPVHFWPGEGNAARRPGARPSCGVVAEPLIATAVPDRVTCRRCLRVARPAMMAAAALQQEGQPIIWPDSLLAGLGMLAPDAPPAGPPPPHYRNPRIGERHPLSALAERIQARAERERGEVRAALRSVAAELADALRVMREGV